MRESVSSSVRRGGLEITGLGLFVAGPFPFPDWILCEVDGVLLASEEYGTNGGGIADDDGALRFEVAGGGGFEGAAKDQTAASYGDGGIASYEAGDSQ
jgi:hypothetical protein